MLNSRSYFTFYENFNSMPLIIVVVISELATNILNLKIKAYINKILNLI